MTDMHGRHLIAGDWVAGAETFTSTPLTGAGHAVSMGTADHVDAACRAAEAAFETYGYAPRETRAAFLEAIAAEIDARGERITATGMAETGLPEARLNGERGRTVGQLRLFAAHVRATDYLDTRHDGALPDRAPLPRPDLRVMQRPVGPVAVFGASNFPLAFSVAGGDTASALAAGCPVVVKGHEAHPGVTEIVAEAILAAITATGVPAGTVSVVHGGSHEVGGALVRHPLITAVGFTGSLRGGRALFDLCAARPVPIPFFGELGSVNPMFLMPSALAARGEALAQGWAGSLTMGAGQFCTNPGIAIAIEGDAADAFTEAARAALDGAAAQPMLTDGIAEAYRTGRDRLAGHNGVETVLATDNARAGELPKQPALDRVGCEAFGGPEGQRVVRYDHARAAIDRLRRAVGRDGQARHHALDLCRSITDQQADVVPILSEGVAGQMSFNQAATSSTRVMPPAYSIPRCGWYCERSRGANYGVGDEALD